MRSFNQNPEWSIVTELKKQFDVSSVSLDGPIARDIDVLLVAQPSSMTQKQIDNLTDYVKKGGATLLFVDPFPADNRRRCSSPELPKMPPGGPFGGRAAAGAQGEPPAAPRPDRNRMANDRDRLERVQSSSPARAAPRDRLHPQGEWRGRSHSIPIRSPVRGSRRSSRSSPACSAPGPAGPAPSSSRCCVPAVRAASSTGTTSPSRASWASPD